jgi:Ni/Co efflux regulator RcnB
MNIKSLLLLPVLAIPFLLTPSARADDHHRHHGRHHERRIVRHHYHGHHYADDRYERRMHAGRYRYYRNGRYYYRNRVGDGWVYREYPRNSFSINLGF